MEILSLTQPVSEKEVREMHVINQENIPEVGGLADINDFNARVCCCLLYTSPSPRDRTRSRMPSSA